LPETKASLAHNGSISLAAPQGIGEKQFSLNAPASRLKKSCRGGEKRIPLTLTQVLVKTPRMTAAEALLRSQEKARLLAPTMGRQQSEFLGPMVERELDLLEQMGWLPPMPEVLKAAGGIIDVDYSSPLNKAQRAEEGLAIVRTIECVTQLAQVDPTIMYNCDGDAIVRELAEINGVPVRLLRPVEEVLRMKGTLEALNPTMLAQAGAMVGAQTMSDLAQLQNVQGQPLGSGLDVRINQGT